MSRTTSSGPAVQLLELGVAQAPALAGSQDASTETVITIRLENSRRR